MKHLIMMMMALSFAMPAMAQMSKGEAKAKARAIEAKQRAAQEKTANSAPVTDSAGALTLAKINANDINMSKIDPGAGSTADPNCPECVAFAQQNKGCTLGYGNDCQILPAGAAAGATKSGPVAE